MEVILKENVFTIVLTAVCLLSSIFLSILIQKKYEKYGSKELLAYKPTVWTSIGILGTFVSIVYSLKYNQSDFKDIQLLINNISPAFITSIIGIIGSIISSCRVKIEFAVEESKSLSEYAKFVENPDSITDRNCITQEMQLYSIYKNINEINDSNNKNLQSILNYLKNTFDKDGALQKFQYELADQINSTLDKTVGENGSLEKSIGNNIEQLRQTITADLSEDGVVSQKINETIDAIKKLNDTEASTAKFLTKAIGEDGLIKSTIITESTNLKNAIGDMQTELSENLGENGVIAKKIQESMNSVTGELTTQNEKIKKFLDDLTENISEYYRNVSKETAQATVGLIEKNFVDYQTIFSDYNKELGENLIKYGEQLRDLESQFIEDQNKALISSLESNIENLNQRTALIERINNELIEKLESNKDSLVSSVSAMQNELQSVMEDIYKEFVQNANENSGTLKNMSESLIQNTEVNSVQIVEKLNSLQNVIEEFQKIANANDISVQSLTDYLNVNESAIDKFNECLTNIDKNIKDYSGIQSEFVGNYDECLTKLGREISHKLEDSIDRFGENLEDELFMIKSSVNTCIEQNAGATQTVVKQMTKDYGSSNKQEMELLKELKKLL